MARRERVPYGLIVLRKGQQRHPFLALRVYCKKDTADGLTFHFYDQLSFDKKLKKNERMRPNVLE